MAQTYLEQYCIDTTMDIDQRTYILCHVTDHSKQVDEISNEMHHIYAHSWMTAWPKAISVVHLASNGSDTGLSLLAARVAGSHFIVGGSTKSWHGRTSASATRFFVLCSVLAHDEEEAEGD